MQYLWKSDDTSNGNNYSQTQFVIIKALGLAKLSFLDIGIRMCKMIKAAENENKVLNVQKYNLKLMARRNDDMSFNAWN